MPGRCVATVKRRQEYASFSSLSEVKTHMLTANIAADKWKMGSDS